MVARLVARIVARFVARIVARFAARIVAGAVARAVARAVAGRNAAFDLHPHRLASPFEGAQRSVPDRIGAVAADLTEGAPAPDGFFRPCSSGRPRQRHRGVLRRHPEIRWRLTPDRLAELARLQSGLLDTGYRPCARE